MEELIGVFGVPININLDFVDQSEKSICFARVKHSNSDKNLFLSGYKGNLNEN